MSLMRYMLYPVVVLLLPQAGVISKSLNKLEKTQLIIEEKEDAFFKSAPAIDIYKEYLFIVDNALHRVLEFKLHNESLEFIRSIGRHGQGPGDLELPMRISVWKDILAVQDQQGISFFNINGDFMTKFRLFSGCISFLLIDNKIFCAASNPTKSDLIEVYSIEGERLYTFGDKKKIIDFSYNTVKGMSPSTTEMVIFDVVMLSDGSSLYLLNRRFGTVTKFLLSGQKVFETNIAALFGKNEAQKAEENRKLFLVAGYDSFIKDRSIPQNYIFRGARILDNNIFLLTDQWDYMAKKRSPFLELKAIDKNSFKTITTYQSPVLEDERFLSFAVRAKKMSNLFIILFECEEGYRIYQYRPI